MDIDSAFMQLSRRERRQIISELEDLQPGTLMIYDDGSPDLSQCELLGGKAEISWWSAVRADLRKQ